MLNLCWTCFECLCYKLHPSGSHTSCYFHFAAVCQSCLAAALEVQAAQDCPLKCQLEAQDDEDDNDDDDGDILARMGGVAGSSEEESDSEDEPVAAQLPKVHPPQHPPPSSPSPPFNCTVTLAFHPCACIGHVGSHDTQQS